MQTGSRNTKPQRYGLKTSIVWVVRETEHSTGRQTVVYLSAVLIRRDCNSAISARVFPCDRLKEWAKEDKRYEEALGRLKGMKRSAESSP